MTAKTGTPGPLPDARAGKDGPCHSGTCRDRELAPKPFPDGPVAIFKGRRVPEEREFPELLGLLSWLCGDPSQPRRPTGQRRRALP